MRNRVAFRSRLAAAAITAIAAAGGITPAMAAGVVVEHVRQGSPAYLAGLKEGDVLLAWRREASPPANPKPEEGTVDSPFDLDHLWIEQTPRGPVTLQGTRGGEPRSWVLVSGVPYFERDPETAPVFAGEVLEHYRRGRSAIGAGDLDAGLASWRRAAEAAAAEGQERWALWLKVRSARELQKVYRWEEADAVYSAVVPPLEQADDRFLAALLLREWALLFRERKIWDLSDDRLERALAVDRRGGEDTLAVALDLEEIGFGDNLSGGSKDFDSYLQSALKIRRRLAPGSVVVASTWLVWANGAVLDGHLTVAIERYRKALALQAKLSATPLLRIEILNRLGYAYYSQKQMEMAGRIWKEALALGEKVAPEDFLTAGATHGAGVAADLEGDLARAEELLGRAHASYEHLIPGHWNSADALRDLGRVSVKAGKLDAAADQLCRAMEIMEVWRRRFERIEDVRSRWGRFFADYYRECAEALVAVGRGEEAFHMAERGRGRAFLNLFSERKLRLAELAPERLAAWKALDAEYEGTAESLTQAEEATPVDEEEIRNLVGRQREIRRKKDALLASVRPFQAARYPEPLLLEEARGKLDPGTVLLFYSVGKKRTLLFVLESGEGEGKADRSGWEVFTLPVGRDDLETRVRGFRKLVTGDRNAREAILARGRALYDLLLEPAEARLSRAQRVLISPDGPLHVLPFAALANDNGYLAEWKPLHFTLSSTVYATLERRPAADRSHARIAAFGDPLYPQASSREAKKLSDPVLEEVVRRGLAPLPASREEVSSIAGLFPESRVFTGEEATKAKVKEVAASFDLLHFAVHGLLNERSPLDSALALTATDNGEVGSGFLRAWEVMEGLPLEADLVTLSACDSALGVEVKGEGLIGLTRAFQYAGARSVLAALWGIGDSSTAELMPRFYRELRAGKPKDEALRAAQLGLLQSRKSAPFHWAAFQIYGAWD